VSKSKRVKTFQKILQLISKFSQALTKNHLQWLLRNFIVTCRRSFYILAALVISKTQPLARKAVSKPKRTKTFRKPLQLISNFSQPRTKNQLKWLLRSFIITNKRPTATKNGFVLPTAALLLIVMSLLISALLFRSLNRTNQVVGQREEKVIYNAASPAIDRAKAKLEYLFQEDKRRPGGLPSDPDLEDMLRNDGTRRSDGAVFPQADLDDNSSNGIQNPYVFPGEASPLNDETQLDINNDGLLDTAWSFQADTDGDGQITEEDPTVAYSILLKTQEGTVRRENLDDEKAAQLVVRNGPINIGDAGNANCNNLNLAPEAGWDSVNGATVRKTFQVTAFVVGKNKTAATLEMQQDRQATRGNKWGAWFRNDLEIFPGPEFRWNGAMHTEGNLIVGDSNSFRGYLISSPRSCLYSREASEITIAGNSNETTPPFLGQVLNGSLKMNVFGGSSRFNYIDNDRSIKEFTINTDSDSVSASGGTPEAISLDPVVLWTQQKRIDKSRNAEDDPYNSFVRDAAWKESAIVKKGRIFNSSQKPPYLDDTYRADNRYGPKATYNDSIGLNQDANGVNQNRVGDQIQQDSDPNFTKLTLNAPTDPNDTQTFGFDGYWERRARGQGFRTIVGQRLELGNTYGWRANDPLNPPDPAIAVPAPNNARRHELRQWRSLRDNLAAVQATAVYHYNPDGDVSTNDFDNNAYPVACLATTAHPGTPTTITNSTTFNNIGINGQQKINPDFFTGNGTNGWEFNPPGGTIGGVEVATQAEFANALRLGQPLRIALDNLAHFAGDAVSDANFAGNPNPFFGAFPPRQDTRDGNNANDAVPSVGPQVHPYPQLAMWGNYSDLRRVLKLLEQLENEDKGYADLSLADQTTLQTSSCTMGMLAYKMQLLRDYDYANADNRVNLNALDTALTNPALVVPANPTPDNYVAALLPTNPNLARLARFIHLKEQVKRDRQNGFDPSDPFTFNGNLLGCDITANAGGNNFFGAVAAGGTPNTADREKAIRIAQRLCPRVDPALANTVQPKFPSLYYLFPVANHDHSGTATVAGSTVNQPNAEPYINQTYIFNAAVTDDVNDQFIYKVIQDDNDNEIEDGAENGIGTTNGIGAIAIQPRDRRTEWRLPNTENMTNAVNRITDNTDNSNTPARISFLDKGMFNGREMMSVRVLDIDFELLRNNAVSGGETWFPYSGVIYAFREDGVREDASARPAATASVNCNTAAQITEPICRMNAVGANPQDPPVNGLNADGTFPLGSTGISPKPVDFYADPDRRPHGFRLRNGRDLRRNANPEQNSILNGLSFISDNPVYVVGDIIGGQPSFNLHNDANNPNTRIEEFENLLNDDWSDFYTRGTTGGADKLNPNFARVGDSWRPTEIIADAISILSSNFRDGSIAEGIRRQDVDGRSSYRNFNAPNDADLPWVREDGSASNDLAANLSPIKISRNGFPLYCINAAGNTFGNTANCLGNVGAQEKEYGRESVAPLANTGTVRTYRAFAIDKDLIQAADNTRINATIVSGIVPSRAQQSYGGLHNFPRFLETWSNNLFISGALMQLNFSTSATAPFDQDSWEPGAAASNNELIRYYGPPVRNWGYDVGLQYAPAGPVARRFVTLDNTRSEFYRELPVDDPYIKNLRCATNPNSGTKIDPTITDCP
jgi:type II secretory pathway pseudopilin PulG